MLEVERVENRRGLGSVDTDLKILEASEVENLKIRGVDNSELRDF